MFYFLSYKYEKGVCNIEFSSYNLFNDNPPTSLFGWHVDHILKFHTISVILYLRIDKTIRGGNLFVHSNFKRLVQLKNGYIVILDGPIPHKVQPLYGFGVRDNIIISFKKL
jgi:hypothetical protein